MLSLKIHNDKQNGSATAEFVFILPILALIFFIMYQLFLICEAKQKVIQSSRYAAWESACSSKSKTDIENEIKTYILTGDDNIKFKSLTIDKKYSWKRSTSRFGGAIGNLLNGIVNGLDALFDIFPTFDPNNYLDPITSTALFLGIPGTDIQIGLATTAINEEDKNKYEVKLQVDYELEYLKQINELGKILKSEEFNISPITLTDSMVIIGDDWSAKNKQEFAKRVGVPNSYDDITNIDASSFYMGMWLFPIGGTVGQVFNALNYIYGVIEPVKTIISTIGNVVGIETNFNDPIDPRGDYFKTNNAPDYPD